MLVTRISLLGPQRRRCRTRTSSLPYSAWRTLAANASVAEMNRELTLVGLKQSFIPHLSQLSR